MRLGQTALPVPEILGDVGGRLGEWALTLQAATRQLAGSHVMRRALATPRRRPPCYSSQLFHTHGKCVCVLHPCDLMPSAVFSPSRLAQGRTTSATHRLFLCEPRSFGFRYSACHRSADPHVHHDRVVGDLPALSPAFRWRRDVDHDAAADRSTARRLVPLAELVRLRRARRLAAMTAQALVRKRDASRRRPSSSAACAGCLVDSLACLLVDLLEGGYDCAGVHGAPKLHRRARGAAARCARDGGRVVGAQMAASRATRAIALWTRLELDESGRRRPARRARRRRSWRAAPSGAGTGSAARRKTEVHAVSMPATKEPLIHGAAESFFVPQDASRLSGAASVAPSARRSSARASGTQRRVVVSGYELRAALAAAGGSMNRT